MEKSSFWLVKKKNLLALAGTVWLIAGFNVTRMGLVAYSSLKQVTLVSLLLSILVFLAFGSMFYKMTFKHARRISDYKEARRPFWQFFDLKSYLIMIVMMTGGILFRRSGLVPSSFIAFFYTGLGLALALARLLFWIFYFSKKLST
ncbi:hypothetical protein SAMN02910293_00800 [Streptococcus henryi]|uniref:Uncharacterized protein n=1 Tax=Streptococcus henryi TaxID=439219 RepID=A0A1G6B5I5_9STRE|nr:hypothetical protein [Streptococcus henryi]SDB15871.1 hypothetical protein SAMN02910293_00800 [Streptococcus henryi]